MGARIWTMQLTLIAAFCFAMTAAPASSVDAPIALWLDAKSAQASASFGAIGGGDPAALGFDPSLQLTAQRAGQTNSSRTQLSYAKHGARYLAKIPFAAPFLLEASAVVPKVKDGTLVKYWANADRVVRPNDWFEVQDEAKAELEITLRDPWMKQPAASSQQMDTDRQITRRVSINVRGGSRGIWAMRASSLWSGLISHFSAQLRSTSLHMQMALRCVQICSRLQHSVWR